MDVLERIEDTADMANSLIRVNHYYHRGEDIINSPANTGRLTPTAERPSDREAVRFGQQEAARRFWPPEAEATG